MFLKKNFSARVKNLRIANNITQKQLSDIINMSENTISMIENGNRAASIEVMFLLADYFNVSIDYLTGRTDKPEINK